MCVELGALLYIHIYIHTCPEIRGWACSCTYIHTYTHTYIHTQKYVVGRALVHTYIHTQKYVAGRALFKEAASKVGDVLPKLGSLTQKANGLRMEQP